MTYSMKRPASRLAIAVAFAIAATNLPSHAFFGKKECKSLEGTLRISEPDDGLGAWASYGLPAPSRMLRVLVNESKCFTVLDRGVGLAAAQEERALANAGHLAEGQNLHDAQMLGADYVLIPDIMSQNEDAGGGSIGGSVSNGRPKRGLIGGALNVATLGVAGKLSGGMSSRRQTAEVVLTLVDVRTSAQLFTTTGEARISDRAWSAAAAAGSPKGSASANAGRWTNTEIGQVIQKAYEDAYESLMEQVMDRQARRPGGRRGGSILLNTQAGPAGPEGRRLLEREAQPDVPGVRPAVAAAAAAASALSAAGAPSVAEPPLAADVEETVAMHAQQPRAAGREGIDANTLVVRRITRLLAAADSQAETVAELRTGMLVFPTGAREGVLVEVEDEMGNKGWVPEVAVNSVQ
ncbi:CsgG/HfaB family protein [Stenotrophomonas mori]|uniref:CsgG/HfaB family protein n=1 Tax=Stenotrophomonas mori TaxID=2871096 RepID=A0ABT0SIU2_9GAMM|nr:CsgG/HfaB family protein [Stenotrophomonas mori]MCL7715026.1 CsgG/HfaB family protein [Stenotrophomonas mori]